MLAIICIRPRGACFKGQLSAPLLRRWRESPARMTLSLSRKKRKNGIFRSFLLSRILGREKEGEKEGEKEREETRGEARSRVPSPDRRFATKYPYLGAVNGVVNDATSLPFSLSPDSVAATTLSLSLSRVAVTTALLLPVNYTLYSTRATTQPKANCIIER